MKALTLVFVSIFFLNAQNVDALEAAYEKNPNDVDVMYKLAVEYHNMVANETGDKTEDAEALFKKILTAKKDHVEARVYYGSLLTLKGRDAWIPWDKLNFVEQGCDQMDKAVQIDPNNLTVRITRAQNNINLPSFFKRISYCLVDLKFITNHPAFESFDERMKQQLLSLYGQALMANDETEASIEMYSRVVAINKDSDYGKSAAEIISE